MGLARAVELNGYPGPRHVLDAVQADELQAIFEQVQRVHSASKPRSPRPQLQTPTSGYV